MIILKEFAIVRLLMATKYLKAREVAEYFIEKAYSENDKITQKKLQKMLYYAQAWFLAFNNKKLFEEKIEAWLHGPAIYYRIMRSLGRKQERE